MSWNNEEIIVPDQLTFKRRVKSHLPSAGGIIRSSPYFPR